MQRYIIGTDIKIYSLTCQKVSAVTRQFSEKWFGIYRLEGDGMFFLNIFLLLVYCWVGGNKGTNGEITFPCCSTDHYLTSYIPLNEGFYTFLP